MRCNSCGGDDCLQVLVHLKADNFATFGHCHGCGAEWWKKRGLLIGFDDVLAMADV